MSTISVQIAMEDSGHRPARKVIYDAPAGGEIEPNEWLQVKRDWVRVSQEEGG